MLPKKKISACAEEHSANLKDRWISMDECYLRMLGTQKNFFKA